MRSGKLGLLLFMRPFQGVSDQILGLIFFFFFNKKKVKNWDCYGFDVVVGMVASWERLLLWGMQQKI